jgi:hypothetical protein
MRKKQFRDTKTRAGRKAMRKAKKSTLAKEAERLFSFHGTDTPMPSQPATYPVIPMIVQTLTTYSVCEDPIPDPRKLKQA